MKPTGLKPLPDFRLKAGLRHVCIVSGRKVGVPALAGSQQGPSGPSDSLAPHSPMSCGNLMLTLAIGYMQSFAISRSS